MELEPRRIAAAILLPALALAGCAGSADRYPSLSIREFERTPPAPEGTSELRPSPAPTDLPARIEQLLAAATDAHRAFAAAIPDTDRIVGAAIGTSVEDNAWSAAQVALAELDSKRGSTAIVLGDLDTLYTDATVEFAERAEIADARGEVATLIDEEDQVLEQLRSQLDQ